MRARITCNQWIYFDNITTHEEDILWVALSAVRKGRNYVDPNQLANMWDGVYRKYNRAKKRIARPLLGLLEEVCKKHELPLVVKDERPPSAYQHIGLDNITVSSLTGITLEEYQLRWGKVIHDKEVGICSVPTGGGKGELIALTCLAIPCPTIILADQTVVLDQLKERLELRDVAGEIGLFYAGRRPNGQAVVVGSIQSLVAPSKIPVLPDRKQDETDKQWAKTLEKYDLKLKAFKTRRKNARFLLEYLKKAEMIICDECDKATSKSYKSIFRHYFKGRYRYGFSGTPFDPAKPVENLEEMEHLGSIIMHEDRSTVEALGRIVPTEYKAIAFGEEGNPAEGSAYDIAVDEWMISNHKFHRLIADIASLHQHEGTLILVDREPLGLALSAEFEKRGIEAPFIYGKTAKKKRKVILEAFERREYKVLIGGKIINRGLDLCGGTENLIVATTGKMWSDFLQKIGRAVRRNQKGKSRVYGFYFRCNKYLYNHSREHLRYMVEANYPTTVIFKKGSIDGSKLIQARFRIPKELK